MDFAKNDLICRLFISDARDFRRIISVFNFSSSSFNILHNSWAFLYWSNFFKEGWASIKIFKNFWCFSRLSMIITTSHDNKPTDSVSSFVLKTNHAHKFFFLFFFRNAMVSVYSLRPVYTFLYTIINGYAIASFVQKKKSFEIL